MRGIAAGWSVIGSALVVIGVVFGSAALVAIGAALICCDFVGALLGG